MYHCLYDKQRFICQSTHHNTLEHLSGDRRKNSLIVVNTNVSVYPWQLFLLRPKQYPQSNVNILEIWQQLLGKQTPLVVYIF